MSPSSEGHGISPSTPEQRPLRGWRQSYAWPRQQAPPWGQMLSPKSALGTGVLAMSFLPTENFSLYPASCEPRWPRGYLWSPSHLGYPLFTNPAFSCHTAFFSFRKCGDTFSHCCTHKGLLLVCKNLKILKGLFLKRNSLGLLSNYKFETAFADTVHYWKPEKEIGAGEGSGAISSEVTLPTSGNIQRQEHPLLPLFPVCYSV